MRDPLSSGANSFAEAVRVHPFKALGILETIFWALIVISLIDHLRSPASLTSFIVWALIIGWHELGHLICSPFGTFIMFAGGSIWQVLIWLMIGLTLLVRRRLGGALLALAVGGHSLINLARYIDDARARKLQLLFGLDSTHHDWWYLLSHVGLLNWDHFFAAVAVLLGVGIVLGASAGGILTAWFLPRTRLRLNRRV